MMGPIAAIKACFSRAMRFNGRAKRAEYWWFILFCIILSSLALYLDMVLFEKSFEEETNSVWPISFVFFLLTLLPLTAVEFRRLRDVGAPGVLAFVTAGLSLWHTFVQIGKESLADFTVLEILEASLVLAILIICLFPSKNEPEDPSPKLAEVFK